MSNEYTDIKIIDCNRLHSIQSRSGNDTNPALFTNELGRGIKLKVGDKVSVKGVYVSEVGAGSDTVELKGTNIGKKRTVSYTLEEPIYPTTLDDSYSNGSDALPLITGYQEYNVVNASFTYDLKDNETYLTIQYYLNNAGDSGHISLPRRFASLLASEEDNSHYTNLDNTDQGRPYQEVHEGQFVTDDYMYYDNSTSETNTGFYKLRTDCSRFTLMKRLGETKLRRETVKSGGNVDNEFPPILDYCMGAKYTTFNQLIKIKVNEGFNSPESISNEVTRQLKEASEPYDFVVKYQGIEKPVSQYYNTETFKPQLCASNFTMEQKQYEYFTFNRDEGSIPINTRKEGAWAYYSNYYNVYHKRPEIREAGQGLNNLWGSDIHNIHFISIVDRTTVSLTISLEYTEQNLNDLKAVFDAEKIYPELFNNENAQRIQPEFNGIKMSVDNARYLHMNTQYSTTRNASLGGDNLDFNASNVNNQSLPLFFYFDKNNENKFTDGTDENDLCYGFASKERFGTKDYIVLHPEKLGGINAGLFKDINGSGANMAGGTLLGYDHNYNAYGTACLMGYSGRLRYDYPTANEWGIGDRNLWKQDPALHGGAHNPLSLSTAEFMRYNYVGCNNPLFKYDPDNSRFYFSQLHTPELAGQDWVSAGDNGSGVSPKIEDNTENGGAVVYKINKRINPYTYTPDMKPYVYDYEVKYPYGHSSSSDIERRISQPNRSIYPWTIFDSLSGIYISDFGYDEKEWDNGLWGLLGFTYNQFNKTLTSTNNRLSRIINTNINDLNLPTTNADIVSSDTRNFIVNQFGAVYFTNQLPTSSTIEDRDFLPAITNNADSIKLYALNLPRKMLKPYYCIRSDIIDAPHYIGGDTSYNELPVVAICDKQYSGGDFYFSSDEDFIFTITKEKTITNITTSIHDPNQSFSQVNNDSAVIYKIQSQVINETDLAQQLLDRLRKK